MIDKLRKLVLEGGYDAESKAEVAALEERLHRAVITEKLAEHPVIKDFLTFLDIEIDRCNYLLSNDEKLTETERGKLFAKREMSEHFRKLFISEKSAVESEIKSLLDVVTTQ